MSKHYDVVVLGNGIGALTSAALLARRSWRVLVVGQGRLPPCYRYDAFRLARRSFALLAYTSPALSRVLVELAQSQTFRRRVRWLEPMVQVLGDRYRLDLPPDTTLFAREIDREFPEVRRVVDELYGALAQGNAVVDAAFDRDAVWPPGSFWERRETLRLAEGLPFRAADPLAEFPREHPYRQVVTGTARVASNGAGDPSSFALARLHGAWTRGMPALDGGEDELIDFLVERVNAHGGEARFHDRVSTIVQRGGKIRAVQIDGEAAAYGAQFVVSDQSTSELLALAPDFDVSRKSALRLEATRAVEGRFVVSLVVRDEAIPGSLAAYAVLLPRREGDLEVFLEKRKSEEPGTTLLVASALVPIDEPKTRLRERVLAAVESHLPYLERHVVIVDSPHDGRALWDFRSGKRHEIDRAKLRPQGGSLEAEPMVPRYEIPPEDPLGIGGEPLRTPLANAFVVGGTVLPSLGQEGECLAAWGAARIITRTDRRKEKMRLEMWSKVELA